MAEETRNFKNLEDHIKKVDSQLQSFIGDSNTKFHTMEMHLGSLFAALEADREARKAQWEQNQSQFVEIRESLIQLRKGKWIDGLAEKENKMASSSRSHSEPLVNLTQDINVGLHAAGINIQMPNSFNSIHLPKLDFPLFNGGRGVTQSHPDKMVEQIDVSHSMGLQLSAHNMFDEMPEPTVHLFPAAHDDIDEVSAMGNNSNMFDASSFDIDVDRFGKNKVRIDRIIVANSEVGEETLDCMPFVPVEINTFSFETAYSHNNAELALARYIHDDIDVNKVGFLNEVFELCQVPDFTYKRPNEYFLGMNGCLHGVGRVCLFHFDVRYLLFSMGIRIKQHGFSQFKVFDRGKLLSIPINGILDMRVGIVVLLASGC